MGGNRRQTWLREDPEEAQSILRGHQRREVTQDKVRGKAAWTSLKDRVTSRAWKLWREEAQELEMGVNSK